MRKNSPRSARPFLILVLCLLAGGGFTTPVSAQCDPCPGPGNWDTRNCHVMTAPPGSNAFLYYDHLYVTSPTGEASGCPAGTSWDTANCHVAEIPPGRKAFVYNNSLYLTPVCDVDGPRKRVFITHVKLHGVKSGRLDRDDVSWVAMLYDNNQCTDRTALARESIAKVAQRYVGSWRSTSPQEITAYPDFYLEPNWTIALMLYDRDSCRGCQVQFKYDLFCQGNLYGRSKSTPYGSTYLKYRDFLGTEPVEVDLGGARLRLRAENVP